MSYRNEYGNTLIERELIERLEYRKELYEDIEQYTLKLNEYNELYEKALQDGMNLMKRYFKYQDEYFSKYDSNYEQNCIDYERKTYFNEIKISNLIEKVEKIKFNIEKKNIELRKC
ncbi:MAG: hypothetical protein WBA74_17305 [Cyclobacteriaceae bacterium]